MEKSWANELWRTKKTIALIPCVWPKHDDVGAVSLRMDEELKDAMLRGVWYEGRWKRKLKKIYYYPNILW